MISIATLDNEKATLGEVADSGENGSDLQTQSTKKTNFPKSHSYGNSNKKSLYDLERECLAAMTANELTLDGKLITDGQLHRYSCDGKKNEPDEWYVAHAGISDRGNQYLNVVYGTFSGGFEKFYFNSWKKDRTISKNERESIEQRSVEQKKEVDKKIAEEVERKAAKAQKEWDAASDTPNSAQAYLDCKKVGAHGVRFGMRSFNDGTEQNPVFHDYNTVLIPLKTIDGQLRAVEHIRADGVKRITGPKKGAFHQIGVITSDSVIFVAEGYSTGVPSYEVIGDPTVIAVDCYNLLHVVEAFRDKYPKNRIIILGDDDVETVDKNTGELSNPGRTKAETAAKIHRCQVAFPKFQEDFRLKNGKRPKDWNDLRVNFGDAEVKKQLSIIIENNTQAIQIFSHEDLKKALEDNECGDASLFKKLCGKDYIYDPDEKLFYIWNGTSWILDKEKTRYLKLEIIASQYADEADHLSALSEEDDKSTKRLVKELRDRSKYLKTTRRMGFVLEAATFGSISNVGLTFNGKWDDCTGYLPCANGLVNLKTGQLSESSRDHFIRKHSQIKYDVSAKCPVFEKFVVEIMGDKINLAKFLQRLIGYICIGCPSEHIYVFLYGAEGRNGKGTLTRLIAKTLGHLARQFPSELILLQRNPPSSGTPRPDLVHLQGTRFALFSEINKGRFVDSAVLKNLSGGDNIAARSLFSNDQKDFPPTHTLLFQANHKPKAPSDDPALWSRSVLIPFNITFVDDPKLPHERKKDKGLEAKLEEAELPGILRWIVEGAVEYHKNGLLIPQEVRAAVDEYRNENDGIGTFLKERCDLYPELSTKCSVIRDAIQKYCESEGFNKPTKNEITQTLISKGFSKESRRDGDYWRKISIKSEN